MKSKPEAQTVTQMQCGRAAVFLRDAEDTEPALELRFRALVKRDDKGPFCDEKRTFRGDEGPFISIKAPFVSIKALFVSMKAPFHAETANAGAMRTSCGRRS